eukprot:Nitzschia sp. Nitz4//scaffold30_size153850//149716//151035//NITZ4_002805-RA/size153850-processed-gene-0.29-mRNA-1//1//CDS//3329547345//2870//frame0
MPQSNTDRGNTEIITELRSADVLCGRIGAAKKHPGNVVYRRLVDENRKLYVTCPAGNKQYISKSIVTAIRNQNGRFLERNSDMQTYTDIGEAKAVLKTSQALREGQEALKKKLNQEAQSNVATAPPEKIAKPREIHLAETSRDQSELDAGPSFLSEGDISAIGDSFLSSEGGSAVAKPNMDIEVTPPPKHPPARVVTADIDSEMKQLSITSADDPPSIRPISVNHSSMLSAKHPSLQPDDLEAIASLTSLGGSFPSSISPSVMSMDQGVSGLSSGVRKVDSLQPGDLSAMNSLISMGDSSSFPSISPSVMSMGRSSERPQPIPSMRSTDLAPTRSLASVGESTIASFAMSVDLENNQSRLVPSLVQGGSGVAAELGMPSGVTMSSQVSNFSEFGMDNAEPDSIRLDSYPLDPNAPPPPPPARSANAFVGHHPDLYDFQS